MKYILALLLFVGLLASRPNPAPRVATDDIITNPCKTIDGKDRPYPCEFQLHTIWFMGKNNEVLAQSSAQTQVVKLPKSKAVSSTSSPQGGTLYYNVSVDFSRINKPSFPTTTYTLSQATLSTTPMTAGEKSSLLTDIVVSPSLPPPFARPNRVTFKLQLNYAGSGSATTLVAPVPKLLMLENPVTYAKLSNLPQYRDRTEVWRILQVSVDFLH
ncbi:hypothetical protein ACAW74_18820 [Fibrella sp. WM1]|uniref:hypothetical protein n=1 Tax=Fibrella musci TaxID=3242485 RepID=UPI003521CC15